MKIRRNALFCFSAFILSLFLIINPLGVIRFTVEKVNAQSAPRPFVVFVDGSGDCCAWAMDNLQSRLRGLNAEIWQTTYASFRNGSTTRQVSIPRTISLSVDADAAFLRQGTDYINNRLDRNRPLILIGHSFGGDSILSLIPRINRRIQFVAVIDPVSAGGLRQTIVQNRSVPSNVDYFFNRWQQNQPFPFDFNRSGQVFSCEASNQGRRNCDQEAQNIARNADSSPVTRECRWDEVTCPGFVAPNPLIGRPGRRGRAQVQVSHQDLPRDAYIQNILGERISQVLATFRPPAQSNVVSGDRLIQTGSGRCLTTPDLSSDPNGANNGANVFLYDCYNANNTGYNQRWQPRQEGDSIRIIQTSSGKCLTTPDLASNPNGANNGADVFLYDCYNAGGTGYNQLWRSQQEVDSYRIIQTSSGKCLTTPDLASNPNGANNGADVFLYDCYDAGGIGYNQRWRIQN